MAKFHFPNYSIVKKFTLLNFSFKAQRCKSYSGKILYHYMIFGESV